MLTPPRLLPGAKVALVAPAGPLGSQDELDFAVAQTLALGFTPVTTANALHKTGYLAGHDNVRSESLNRALTNDSIDAIWCLRGGYGAMRILSTLDVDAMRRRPKPIIGYSDITALHAAFSAAGAITYHGPTAREPMSDFSRTAFITALCTGENPCGFAPAAHTLRGGRAQGRLVGGNLAILAALAGTAYAPDYTNGILVLEDVGEAPYRIDRMLRQLMLSGAADSLAGIAIGHFTNHGAEHANSLEQLLQEFADAAAVPAIHGIPMGHIDKQWTIPLGATAMLDADECRLDVRSD